MDENELMLEMDMQGYKRTHNPIDAAVVAEGDACEACSGTMHYRGYRKGDSYRAFAVCEDCGHAVEF